MNDHCGFILKNAKRCSALAGIASMLTLLAPVLEPQNADLQQRVADLKESTATNKEELRKYTWLERVTISLRGPDEHQHCYLHGRP